MNERHRIYFRNKLVAWKEEIVRQNRETLHILVEDSAQVQDWIDQAQALWGTVTGVPGGTLPPIEPQAALGVARSVVSALAPAVTSLAFSVLIVIYVIVLLLL